MEQTMAVDSEQVQETQEADQTADNSTTAEIPGAETPTEIQPEATAEGTQETTETPAEQETVEVPGKPAWDPERQKRDEEKARKQKEQLAELARQAAREELKTLGVSPTVQTSTTKDELEQAEAVEAEARKIRADYRKALKEADTELAADLDAQYEEKVAEANKLRSTHARKLEQRQVIREQQEQQKAAVDAEVDAFLADHPEYDTARFKQAVVECREKAAKAGYEGKALNLRYQELMQEKLSSLKRSKPAPKPNQQPTKKTDAPASSSTPPGTRVTPSGAGVRPAPMQTGGAAKSLGAYFRSSLRGK
jgi:hypothetical protein